MPLIHGSSRSDVSTNIREMIASGHPRRQAVAAALSTADRYGKRAAGGSTGAPTVPHYATAAPSINSSGFVPVAQPDPNSTLDLTTGALSPSTKAALQNFAMRGLPGGPDASPPKPPAPVAPPPTPPPIIDYSQMGQNTGGGGGMRRGGKLATGGDPMVGYEQRHAMHAGLNTHPSGLIHTAGPGRTDNVPMTVAPGSHVVPADVVAGLGQGNTLAGAHSLGMAMRGGPGGITLPQGPHKNTIPRPPARKFARGGPVWEGEAIKVARGGCPGGVKCVVAGGEWIMAPHEVAATKHKGKTGHKAVDAWIIERRKIDVDKLKKLPGPVGSSS